MWLTTPWQCAGLLLRDQSEATESPAPPRMAWDPPILKSWPLVSRETTAVQKLAVICKSYTSNVWFFHYSIVFFTDSCSATLFRSDRDNVHGADAHCGVCRQRLCSEQRWTALFPRGGECDHRLVWVNSVKTDPRQARNCDIFHANDVSKHYLVHLHALSHTSLNVEYSSS